LGFKDWQIALPNLNRALNSFAVASSDANPNFAAFQKQSKKSRIQFQRLGFKGQNFKGSLIGFEGFVGFGNTVTGTDSKVSVQPELLPNISVGQVMKDDGVEAASPKCHLTDSVAGSGEDIQRPIQPFLILWRQDQFGDNSQFHQCHH
jgi:hypothetical protein